MRALSYYCILWISLFFTIVDDYSRAVWLYLLPDKAKNAQHLHEFFSIIERQFSINVKTIRSDNEVLSRTWDHT